MKFIQIRLPYHLLMLVNKLPLQEDEKILFSVLLMHSQQNGRYTALPEFLKDVEDAAVLVLAKLLKHKIVLNVTCRVSVFRIQYTARMMSLLSEDSEMVSIRGIDLTSLADQSEPLLKVIRSN